jgi:glutaredoxin
MVVKKSSKISLLEKQTIVLYGTHLCPWCARAREFLKKRKIPFRDVYVDDDKKAAATMARLSGQHHVPVIAVGKNFFVGYDEGELRKLEKKR